MSARDAVKTNEAAPSGDAGSDARERAAEPRNARGQRRARSEAPSFGAFVRKPGRDSASGGALDGRLDGRPDGEPQTAAAAEAGPRAAAQSNWPADAVEVGAVVDAYGLKGWVKVAPHAQDGGALLSAKRWWLLKGNERRLVARLSAKVHGDSVVGQLAGVADRDAALLLRGTRIYVSRAEFPAPAADEYYWVDLIGLDVANEAGVGLGKVADLIDNGAHSVLRVEYPSTGKDGKPSTGERLIPFVGVYVKTVDLAAKRIVVEWEADY